jgi:hypothetical protein
MQQRAIEVYLFGEEYLEEIVVVSFGMQLLFALCHLFGKKEEQSRH